MTSPSRAPPRCWPRRSRPGRRRDVDEHLRTVECQQLGHRQMPEVLADRDARCRGRPASWDGTARSMSPAAKKRRSSNRPYVGRNSLRWMWRMAPSSSSAAAMNRRWSSDSSTNDTTADMSLGRRGEVDRGADRRARIATSAARSWSRYPVRPSSGKTTRPAPDRSRLGDESVMPRQVLVEGGRVGGHLGERDAQGLHAIQSTGVSPGFVPAFPAAPWRSPVQAFQ